MEENIKIKYSCLDMYYISSRQFQYLIQSHTAYVIQQCVYVCVYVYVCVCVYIYIYMDYIQ